MRRSLHLGFEYEFLGKHDSVMMFRDHSSAVRFLRSLDSDSSQMGTLRIIVGEHLRDVHRLSSEQLFRRVGSLLLDGKMRILGTVEVRRSRGQDSTEEMADRQESAAQPAPRPENKCWIEINLRDEDGNPVPGERYRIKLPDASVQEGTLDDFGHAEYYGISPGSCQVSFPGLDDEEWELG